MWDDLKPITEETGQRILDAVSGVEDAAGENRNQGPGWNNLKPMTEETGRRILDAVAQSSRRNQEALDNRIKKFYTGNLGAVNIADSDDGAVRNLVIGGRSEQFSTKGYQLIDVAFNDETKNGVTINRIGSGLYVINGTATENTYFIEKTSAWRTFPAGTYILSFESHAGLTIGSYANVSDEVVTPYWASSGRAFTVSNDLQTFRNQINIGQGAKFENYILRIMVENGETAHEWEPYTGGAPSPSPEYPQEIKSVKNCSMIVSNSDGTETQTAAIPFTLRGIGDVRDELYVYADGTGKLVQRIKALILDGSSDEPLRDSGEGSSTRLYLDLPDVVQYTNPNEVIQALCDHYRRFSYNQSWTNQNYFIVGRPEGPSNIYIRRLDGIGLSEFREILNSNPLTLLYVLADPVETPLTAEQVKALFDLRTYYCGTNISYQSDNGVEPVVNIDYACALEKFVEYIKAAQGDDRKLIYDMDERMTDAEYVAALAYVNSEYATALTELEV